jgi:predicted amidophosphoribosyltransferase
MRRIVVTLVFVAAAICVVMTLICYRPLLAQPRVCEKCDRPATKLTADGLDMCEECAKEYMTELKENE